MSRADTFRGKFSLNTYNNLRTFGDIGDCQTTIEDFMHLVESNDSDLLTSKGFRLMDSFCAMVRCDDVWPAAEMVVPQFRMTMDENGNPQGNCLQYVLTNINRLPTRADRHNLTTEQDMIRMRHRIQATALMTGGYSADDLLLDEEEAKELDDFTAKLDSLAMDATPSRTSKRVKLRPVEHRKGRPTKKTKQRKGKGKENKVKAGEIDDSEETDDGELYKDESDLKEDNE